MTGLAQVDIRGLQALGVRLHRRLILNECIRVNATFKPDGIGLGKATDRSIVRPVPVVSQPRLPIPILPRHPQVQREDPRSDGVLHRRTIPKRLGQPAPALLARTVNDHSRRAQVVGLNERHLRAGGSPIEDGHERAL
jgi:hypothetical protein